MKTTILELFAWFVMCAVSAAQSTPVFLEGRDQSWRLFPSRAEVSVTPDALVWRTGERSCRVVLPAGWSVVEGVPSTITASSIDDEGRAALRVAVSLALIDPDGRPVAKIETGGQGHLELSADGSDAHVFTELVASSDGEMPAPLIEQATVDAQGRIVWMTPLVGRSAGPDPAASSSAGGAVLTQQLAYATFIGGSSSEVLTDLAYTHDERLVLAGRTASLDFPVSEDALDDELFGALDGVVLVMSANGTELLHATFIGGDAFDSTDFVEVAPNGDLLIGGTTSPPDFPVTAGAFDVSPNGGPTDLFVARLSSDAKTLIASTYLGGASDIDQIRALGIHPVDGSILVAGRTCSADWPTTPGALSTSCNGVCDLWFTRLTPQLDGVIASTYWGGFDADALVAAEFLDDGSVVFLAATGVDPWPVTLPDGAFAGATSDNRPLVRLSDTLDAILWSSQVDATFDAIRQKPDGSLVLVGSTGSVDYPTTPGAFAEVSASPPDFVVTSITPDGTTLL